MKSIQEKNTTRDQFSVYGEEVGIRIRDLTSSNAQKITKHAISNILFEAEMGKYDNVTHFQHFNPQFYPPFPNPPYPSPPLNYPSSSSSQYPGQMPTNNYHNQSSNTFTSPASSSHEHDNDSISSILMDL